MVELESQSGRLAPCDWAAAAWTAAAARLSELRERSVAADAGMKEAVDLASLEAGLETFDKIYEHLEKTAAAAEGIVDDHGAIISTYEAYLDLITGPQWNDEWGRAEVWLEETDATVERIRELPRWLHDELVERKKWMRHVEERQAKAKTIFSRRLPKMREFREKKEKMEDVLDQEEEKLEWLASSEGQALPVPEANSRIEEIETRLRGADGQLREVERMARDLDPLTDPPQKAANLREAHQRLLALCKKRRADFGAISSERQELQTLLVWVVEFWTILTTMRSSEWSDVGEVERHLVTLTQSEEQLAAREKVLAAITNPALQAEAEAARGKLKDAREQIAGSRQSLELTRTYLLLIQDLLERLKSIQEHLQSSETAAQSSTATLASLKQELGKLAAVDKDIRELETLNAGAKEAAATFPEGSPLRARQALVDEVLVGIKTSRSSVQDFIDALTGHMAGFLEAVEAEKASQAKTDKRLTKLEKQKKMDPAAKLASVEELAPMLGELTAPLSLKSQSELESLDWVKTEVGKQEKERMSLVQRIKALLERLQGDIQANLALSEDWKQLLAAMDAATRELKQTREGIHPLPPAELEKRQTALRKVQTVQIEPLEARVTVLVGKLESVAQTEREGMQPGDLREHHGQLRALASEIEAEADALLKLAALLAEAEAGLKPLRANNADGQKLLTTTDAKSESISAQIECLEKDKPEYPRLQTLLKGALELSEANLPQEFSDKVAVLDTKVAETLRDHEDVLAKLKARQSALADFDKSAESLRGELEQLEHDLGSASTSESGEEKSKGKKGKKGKKEKLPLPGTSNGSTSPASLQWLQDLAPKLSATNGRLKDLDKSAAGLAPLSEPPKTAKQLREEFEGLQGRHADQLKAAEEAEAARGKRSEEWRLLLVWLTEILVKIEELRKAEPTEANRLALQALLFELESRQGELNAELEATGEDPQLAEDLVSIRRSFANASQAGQSGLSEMDGARVGAFTVLLDQLEGQDREVKEALAAVEAAKKNPDTKDSDLAALLERLRALLAGWGSRKDQLKQAKEQSGDGMPAEQLTRLETLGKVGEKPKSDLESAESWMSRLLDRLRQFLSDEVNLKKKLEAAEKKAAALEKEAKSAGTDTARLAAVHKKVEEMVEQQEGDASLGPLEHCNAELHSLSADLDPPFTWAPKRSEDYNRRTTQVVDSVMNLLNELGKKEEELSGLEKEAKDAKEELRKLKKDADSQLRGAEKEADPQAVATRLTGLTPLKTSSESLKERLGPLAAKLRDAGHGKEAEELEKGREQLATCLTDGEAGLKALYELLLLLQDYNTRVIAIDKDIQDANSALSSSEADDGALSSVRERMEADQGLLKDLTESLMSAEERLGATLPKDLKSKLTGARKELNGKSQEFSGRLVDLRKREEALSRFNNQAAGIKTELDAVNVALESPALLKEAATAMAAKPRKKTKSRSSESENNGTEAVATPDSLLDRVKAQDQPIGALEKMAAKELKPMKPPVQRAAALKNQAEELKSRCKSVAVQAEQAAADAATSQWDALFAATSGDLDTEESSLPTDAAPAQNKTAISAAQAPKWTESFQQLSEQMPSGKTAGERPGKLKSLQKRLKDWLAELEKRLAAAELSALTSEWDEAFASRNTSLVNTTALAGNPNQTPEQLQQHIDALKAAEWSSGFQSLTDGLGALGKAKADRPDWVKRLRKEHSDLIGKLESRLAAQKGDAATGEWDERYSGLNTDLTNIKALAGNPKLSQQQLGSHIAALKTEKWPSGFKQLSDGLSGLPKSSAGERKGWLSDLQKEHKALLSQLEKRQGEAEQAAAGKRKDLFARLDQLSAWMRPSLDASEAVASEPSMPTAAVIRGEIEKLEGKKWLGGIADAKSAIAELESLPDVDAEGLAGRKSIHEDMAKRHSICIPILKKRLKEAETSEAAAAKEAEAAKAAAAKEAAEAKEAAAKAAAAAKAEKAKEERFWAAHRELETALKKAEKEAERLRVAANKGASERTRSAQGLKRLVESLRGEEGRVVGVERLAYSPQDRDGGSSTA